MPGLLKLFLTLLLAFSVNAEVICVKKNQKVVNGNKVKTGKVVKLFEGDTCPKKYNLLIDTSTLKGKDGIDGTNGKDGINGEQGLIGPKGDQGIQGPQGIQGVQGIQGNQGTFDPTLCVFEERETPTFESNHSVVLKCGDENTSNGSGVTDYMAQYYFTIWPETENGYQKQAYIQTIDPFLDATNTYANGLFAQSASDYNGTTIKEHKLKVKIFCCPVN